MILSLPKPWPDDVTFPIVPNPIEWLKRFILNIVDLFKHTPEPTSITAPTHRDHVFDELYRLVSEYDEVASAGDSSGGWHVDDALSVLIVRLNVETRRARKLRNMFEPQPAASAA